MARRRKNRNQSLPPNLYLNMQNYYRYKRIDTGTWHNLGLDRAKAISAAKQLNSIIMVGRDLVEEVLGEKIIFNKFLDDFESITLPERKLSKHTLADYRNKLIYIRKGFGNKVIEEINVLNIADFLKEFPPTLSNRYRSLLIIIFKYAVAQGLCEENPAEKTIPKKLTKSRKRLTLFEFRQIYEKADVWLKNAMDLALQTLQRREDILNIKFSDIKEGCLYIIQRKTQKHGESAYIKIKIEKPLQDVIDRCRSKILSPFLVHRLPQKLTPINERKNKEDYIHHTQVAPDYLTKAFSEIRDSLDIFSSIPSNERPTFHEIRSLGIKLYEDQGIDAQALAGHANREMTDKYKAGHEVNWTMAIGGLNI